jgi:hypothetical protein
LIIFKYCKFENLLLKDACIRSITPVSLTIRHSNFSNVSDDGTTGAAIFCEQSFEILFILFILLYFFILFFFFDGIIYLCRWYL